jgi:AcrR family transcriptional regulator
MTSIRHIDGGVLDAVRDCVLAVGFRRTTLTDVARRAGVSRMTLYRRYPDVNALVRELMTREFGALLREASEAARVRGNGRSRLVATAVRAASRLREDELFRRVIDVDPDLLLRYIVDRLGSTQRLALDSVAAAIVAGHADGSIRPGDVQQLAHVVLLLAQPFVHSARTVVDVLDGAALDRELAEVLDRYLSP